MASQNPLIGCDRCGSAEGHTGLQNIDPAPAVARQVERVLAERGLLSRRAADEARDVFETTGDLAAFEKFVKSVKENVREK